jgi:hypothetical protein
MRPAPHAPAGGEAVADIDAEVEEALRLHDGDPRAALADALIELDALRRELRLAGSAVSAGYTRGWRPAP